MFRRRPHDQFAAMGLPGYMVSGLTSFYATLGAGEYARPSKDVERLTGRRSTSAVTTCRSSPDAATCRRAHTNDYVQHACGVHIAWRWPVALRKPHLGKDTVKKPIVERSGLLGGPGGS